MLAPSSLDDVMWIVTSYLPSLDVNHHLWFIL